MVNATDYVVRGLALTGIPKGLKRPVTTGWNLQKNAITNPKDAASLKENIGLLHAYCSPTPTMALDVDDYAKAEAWLAERGVDLAELMNDEGAVQIVSGKKGRAKLIYRLRVGMTPIRTLQIEAPNGEMILEFRCAAANGNSMQDVLPPSIHPDTGQPYQWGGKGSYKNIPTMPNLLLKVWVDQLAPVAANTNTAVAVWTCNGLVPVTCFLLCHLRFECQGAYAAQI